MYFVEYYYIVSVAEILYGFEDTYFAYHYHIHFRAYSFLNSMYTTHGASYCVWHEIQLNYLNTIDDTIANYVL